MKYHVQEFVRDHWHVVDETGFPIYDGSPNGDDAPVIFRDYDRACECAEELNEKDGN